MSQDTITENSSKEHWNESIVNEVILEDLKQNRIDGLGAASERVA